MSRDTPFPRVARGGRRTPLALSGHKLWIFPFPQLSQLRQNYGANFRSFSGERGYYTSDSTTGHIHNPYATRVYIWEEHPKRAIRLTVSNLGFREDSDTKRQKDLKKYRILVTGNSHMDGVVYNSESFSNRLETMLNLRGKNLKLEVLNGGTRRPVHRR